MKRKIFSTLVLALALEAGAGAYGIFDEKNIVLSLGAISDVHIDSPANAVADKFTNALRQLGETAAKDDPDGLDGVLVVGDLVNNPYKDPSAYVQVDYFRDLYKSVYPDLSRVPMVYTQGNHDTFKEWNENTVQEGKNISSRLGPEFFLTDQDNDARESMACRHCLIGSTHVLCMTPNGKSPVVYDSKAIEWLDARLAEITAADPDKYVLVLTHAMISNTVYGSMLGNYWSTAALTPVLEKYPQAVAFGGHLHFPLNDPRSIWQGKFTAMGTSSVRYMALENGHYEYMAGATVMKDRDEYSQGLLLQFDVHGNMRITRMDFYHGASIDEPWVLSHPEPSLKHLKPYRHDTRMKANRRPSLSTMDIQVGEAVKGVVWPVNLVFASGKDDEFVHHYVITLKTNGEQQLVKKILADFYRHPQTSEMKTLWNEPVAQLPKGEYEISLVAVDSWGAESKALVRKFSL